MHAAAKQLLPNLAAEGLRVKVDRPGIVMFRYVAGMARLKLIINEPMLLASMGCLGKGVNSTTGPSG